MSNSNSPIFADHSNTVLHAPEPGKPRLGWIVGVGSDGSYVRSGWDGSRDCIPHLLIGGSSGSGKSMILNSLLCQLMHNNAPQDVVFCLADRGFELTAYKNVAHVSKFIDCSFNARSIYAEVADWLTELSEEIQRRLRIFASHYRYPQQLSEAKAIAQIEPEKSGHLDLPYVFLVFEEASAFFAHPCDETDHMAHSKILSALREVSYKGRSVGVHVVAVAQYPDPLNVPSVLADQAQRIGLRTQTETASKWIIGRSGLEQLRTPGDAIVSSFANDERQERCRAFLLTRDESSDPRTDERADLIAGLPSK